jgi:hypothetical protein
VSSAIRVVLGGITDRIRNSSSTDSARSCRVMVTGERFTDVVIANPRGRHRTCVFSARFPERRQSQDRIKEVGHRGLGDLKGQRRPGNWL